MQQRSRSPAPARPPDDREESVGLRVASGTDGVRCTTPGCGRKLAESLSGTLTIRCDRCRHLVTITRQ